MKRTNEEFKAEVFRRRDEYLKKKKARRNRVLSICVPFAACFTFFAAMMIPAMMPASKADYSPIENGSSIYNYTDYTYENGMTENGMTTKVYMLFSIEDVTSIIVKEANVAESFDPDAGKGKLSQESSHDIIWHLSIICTTAEKTDISDSEVFDGYPIYRLEVLSDNGPLGEIKIYIDRILVNDTFYEISSEQFVEISSLISNSSKN